MKQDQNFRLSNHNLALTLKKTQRPTNPQSETPSAVKGELSPSNKSYNLHSKRNLQNLAKEESVSPLKTDALLKRHVLQLQERVQQYRQGQVMFKDQIQEIHKQNVELTLTNQVLRTELFTREQERKDSDNDKETVRLLDEEVIKLQKMINDLEIQLRQKTQLISNQSLAKVHNSQMLSEMQFQIRQLQEIYDIQRDRSRQLANKLKLSHDAQSRTKVRLRELQHKVSDMSVRDTSQSMRMLDRELENTRQKVKVLTGINQRQKLQITDLMTALQAKKTSSTLTEIKHEWSNSCPFEQDCSEISKTPEEAELQETIKRLTCQGQRLKQQLQVIRSCPESVRVESLLIEKTEYSKQVAEQYTQISKLNEELYRYNTENFSLREDKEHYFMVSREVEEINIKIAEELKQAEQAKIKYMKQVAQLMESLEGYGVLKLVYERLEQEYGRLETQLTEVSASREELARKNKEVLDYLQELRTDSQRLNQALIEKTYQCEQLKSQKLLVPTPVLYRRDSDQEKVARLLTQRNIFLLSTFGKFKQTVLDELRVLTLQLAISQRNHQGQEVQDVIRTLKRRVDSLLDTI